MLTLSKKLKIDGIVAYASDPSAPTQAYVANQIGLPSNPYQSIRILYRKDLFRSFLDKHHFYTPTSKSFYQLKEATLFFNSLKKPVMVKPVDSSGSKGVTKIFTEDLLPGAFEYALQFSREKKVVIEEFFQRAGYQVAGDGFIVNGKLAFRCRANEHFDKLCNALGWCLPMYDIQTKLKLM